MKHSLKNSEVLSLVMQAFYLLFFVSLVCAFNFISSISTGLILLTGLLKNRIEHKPVFHKNVNTLFLAACILFYLFQFSTLLYTHNMNEAWNDIRIKSGLLFVPMALCCTDYINSNTRKKLFPLFSIILTTACLYCLTITFFKYLHTHDTSQFFFHPLVSPFSQHAIDFSIYAFIALLYLIESSGKKEFIFNKPFHFFLILFLSAFLFLLSSKLVISFYLLYLLYYAISLAISRKTSRVIATAIVLICILSGIILVSTRNPVSDRFTEIIKTDMSIVKQDQYNPGIYFNDVQFRAIEWKLVIEILNENHSWWTGVSPGDAQSFLDEKYRAKNLYMGNPATGNRGYLGYNTHDQLLESLLQTGIPGMLFFLLILFSLVKMAWQKRNRVLSFTVSLLIAYSLTESVLGRQYSIMLFTFFPLFISLNGKGE